MAATGHEADQPESEAAATDLRRPQTMKVFVSHTRFATRKKKGRLDELIRWLAPKVSDVSGIVDVPGAEDIESSLTADEVGEIFREALKLIDANGLDSPEAHLEYVRRQLRAAVA